MNLFISLRPLGENSLRNLTRNGPFCLDRSPNVIFLHELVVSTLTREWLLVVVRLIGGAYARDIIEGFLQILDSYNLYSQSCPVTEVAWLAISEVILLAASPGVLRQVPLNIAILVIKCTSPNLEGPHRHPRAHLSQLDRIVRRPNEDMTFILVRKRLSANRSSQMFVIKSITPTRGKGYSLPDFDAVVVVHEGNNSVAHLGFARYRLSWREKMLQNCHDSLAQSTVHSVSSCTVTNSTLPGQSANLLNPSKMRWGYASDIVPLRGMSCMRTTLWRLNETVGPLGRWLTVRPVGLPRCS